MRLKYLIPISLFLASQACAQTPRDKNLNLSGNSIINRISTPVGFSREQTEPGSWQQFLQYLPLKADGARVYDYSGKAIANQSSHVAVIDLEIGRKNIQQCADAIIRLRADYLWEVDRKKDISFQFTSGHTYRWSDHASGIRPSVSGNSVAFSRIALPNNSYESFQKYLETVYIYAGTISLYQQFPKKLRQADLEIGDIILKPGSPGHAVVVVDRAKNAAGEYIYLLAQGFTPAQSIHVIDSKQAGIRPWFNIPRTGSFITERFLFLNPSVVYFE